MAILLYSVLSAFDVFETEIRVVGNLKKLVQVAFGTNMRPDGFIIFNFLAIYMNENLPNGIKYLSKKSQKYVKY